MTARGETAGSTGAMHTSAASAEPEVSLLDIAAVLGRRKGLLAGATLAAMAASAAVALLIPASYTAEAVILPPQSDQSSQLLMMGSPAGLAGLGGLGSGLAGGLLRNPAELYIGILKSRTIADALIARFRLQQVYGSKSLIGTRKALERHSSIETGKDLLIRIRIEDRDRTRAAQIANAYVDELHNRNSRLALTSAAQRRLFFEQQLAEERNSLADAEIAMKKMQQSSGLVFPSGQSEALMRSIASLRAEIAAREVQLQGMRMYATGDNPQVQVMETTLAGLHQQLQKLEAGSGEELVVPARKIPETELEYLRKMRDFKYQETLFELLAKQYESARIDEAREAPLVQVVDSAVAPDRKSWPPRTLFVLVGGLLALIAASLFVLLQDYRVRMRPAR
ncbi:MAG: Wzz/FepE/Etk N-terminal domain-containing protein [Bryobacteraceae bacterium]